MKITDLKPEQVLYDLHKYKMGNTTQRTWGVWRVRVIDVEADGKAFTASWNGNAPKRFWKVPSTWKKNEPVMIKEDGFLRERPATRAEIKAMMEKAAAADRG